jgi:peptide/nickel transport system substrate-binding protein
MRPRTAIAPLAPLAAAGLLLAGCGGASEAGSTSGSTQPAPSTRAGAPGRGITIAATEDPGSMDPDAGSGNGEFVHQLIYDPLVNLDVDGKVVSGLARSWRGDARSMTFTLRDDATCADGSPVTPSLVARNFKRMEDPTLPVPNLRLTTKSAPPASRTDSC